MTRIILHVGDKVTHSTLGEGVVTIVDEEYVTIKFATDELTFRLPDAFEKGFLSSRAAIVEDAEEVEEEEEINEKDEEREDNECPQKPTHTIPSSKPHIRISVTAIIVAIIMGLIFVPIGFQLFETGAKYDELFFYIIGFIFCCAPIIGFVVGSIETGGKGTVHKNEIRQNKQSGIDPLTELELGLMGSEILHNAIEREKRASEKRRYDSLYWQESIRDKNPRHDFDYDHMDD